MLLENGLTTKMEPSLLFYVSYSYFIENDL